MLLYKNIRYCLSCITKLLVPVKNCVSFIQIWLKFLYEVPSVNVNYVSPWTTQNGSTIQKCYLSQHYDVYTNPKTLSHNIVIHTLKTLKQKPISECIQFYILVRFKI